MVLDMEKAAAVGGVQSWSMGDAYPFTVVGQGKPPEVRWHVIGPNRFDSRAFAPKGFTSAQAESVAVYQRKLYDRNNQIKRVGSAIAAALRGMRIVGRNTCACGRLLNGR